METWRNGVATAGKKQKKEEKKLTEENKHPVSANTRILWWAHLQETCHWAGEIFIHLVEGSLNINPDHLKYIMEWS